MLTIEKVDFSLINLLDQKLINYLSFFPFQKSKKYIFAFGIKDVAVFWDKKKKCQLDMEIAQFVQIAQSRNHPIIFIGYFRNKSERKKALKCISKYYGNLPIILLKYNNPGLVLELISQLFQGKLVYTDVKASNIVNVSQYVPANDLKVLHYVMHSKKNKLGFRSISSLYMYV